MNIELKIASLADYPTIQNMARFYVYDMSRFCGKDSSDWEMPSDGLYESFDFKNYFTDPTRKAYLIKINNELAGFVLLNNNGQSPKTKWNMGEFFILARFQGQGVGHYVAQEIWKQHPGQWEVSIIPENVTALGFWRKTVNKYTTGNYVEEVVQVSYDQNRTRRYILTFDSHTKN